MAKKNNNYRYRSTCPVACSLDVLGDKWTMIIIRDLFLGASKYGDFLASPEKITTNILADRLKKLEAKEIISKKLYASKPKRYSYYLTPKGLKLSPVMRAMIEWSLKYIPECTWPNHIKKPE
jgi:DNA-binding HxlR family transcriptional regulator